MSVAQSVAVYVAGLLLVLLVAKLLAKPLKVIFKLLINTLFGGIALILINTIGGMWGFGIGVNVITAAVTGILGIPGIVLLYVLKFFFND